jgi:hypothetical protein
MDQKEHFSQFIALAIIVHYHTIHKKRTHSLQSPSRNTQKKLADLFIHYKSHVYANCRYNAGLSTLPSLLRANQGNNPRQFSALRKLLLLRLLINVVAGSDVIADLQHAVLES